MPRTSDKREKLLKSAEKLFHQAGFNQTSIADISRDSGVPLGNVHYYFKTKEALISEVLEQRKHAHIEWYKQLNQLPKPKDRLIKRLDNSIKAKHTLVKYGCPVGSLCQELDKDRKPISKKADSLIELDLAWITEQFQQMGKSNARELGIYLVSAIHGINLVANALNDTKVIDTQLNNLKSWVKGL